MREHRLGDIIDDYCVKCKQIMNHAVVSMLNADPAKVRCRTCHSDHDYRHEQAPPPKVDLRKAALSMLLRAGRVVGRRIGNSAAPEPGAEGAEIVIITPRDYLGTMLDGARWRRESIRRWIDLGESDALSVMESVRR